MNMPIIRLTVQGMEHSIQIALSEHSVQMDKDIQAAVKEFCEPGNITKIISKEVNFRLNDAIQKRVESYFKYGDGGQLIDDIVRRSLPTLDKS